MGSLPPPLPQLAVLATASTHDRVRRRPLLSCKRDSSPKDKLEYIYTEASDNLTVKFAIEKSSINREMVHIRCCDNNKYIVKRNQFSDYIDATAEEAVEDTTLWTCTLFRPQYEDYGTGRKAYCFRHVQSGKYIRSSESLLGDCFLTVASSTKANIALDVLDWSSIVILPKQVIFKGNNGKYLAAVPRPNPPPPNIPGVLRVGLQFSADDPADDSIQQELETMHDNFDGSIYIKSLVRGFVVPITPQYWYSASPSLPLYLIIRPGLEHSTYFTPVKVNANTIGLRTSNGSFLLNSSTNNNFLYEGGQSLTQDTWIQVEEPVLSREIYNVRYRFEDSRVYDETPIVQIIATRENNTEQEHISEVKFEFEEFRERFWRAMVSLELGVTMGFSARIPLISSLNFEVSATFSGEYEWGETKSERSTYGDTYTFPVPPKSRVTAYMIASKATCDIPFDYTVRDVLMDGTPKTYQANGGVYTGVNSFNFGTKTESRPL